MKSEFRKEALLGEARKLVALIDSALALQPKAESKIRLENLRASLLEAAAELSRRLSVAFIGPQKTGKSSIMNSVVDGLCLPVGENGLDRFVTRVTSESLRSSELAARNVRAILQKRKGSVEMSAESLKDFLDDLDQNSHRKDYSDVKELVIYHPDPRLRRMDLLNTPGLFSSEPEIQEMVGTVAAQADVVFWVFGADDFQSRQVDLGVRRILAGRKRKAIGVINKIELAGLDESGDNFGSEKFAKTIEEILGRIRKEYGDLLDPSLIPYSAYRVSDGLHDLSTESFRIALDDAIEDCRELSGDESRLLQERFKRLAELALEAVKIAETEGVALRRQLPTQEVHAADITTQEVIPFVTRKKEALYDLLYTHTARIAELQTPIFQGVLEEYLTTGKLIKHGVWGLFNKKKPLSAVIQAELSKRSGDIEKPIAEIHDAIIHDFLAHVKEAHEQLQSKVREHILTLNIKESEFKREGVDKRDDHRRVATESLQLPDFAGELLKSLSKSMAAVAAQIGPKLMAELAKKIGQEVVEKVGQKAAAEAGERVASAVASKAGGEAAGAAAAKAGGQAAEKGAGVAMGALLRDMVSFWLLINLPSDVHDLIKQVEKSRDDAKAKVEKRLLESARQSARRYEDFFRQSLDSYKDVVIDAIHGDCDRLRKGRTELDEKIRKWGELQEALREFEKVARI